MVFDYILLYFIMCLLYFIIYYYIFIIFYHIYHVFIIFYHIEISFINFYYIYHIFVIFDHPFGHYSLLFGPGSGDFDEIWGGNVQVAGHLDTTPCFLDVEAAILAKSGGLFLYFYFNFLHCILDMFVHLLMNVLSAFVGPFAGPFARGPFAGPMRWWIRVAKTEMRAVPKTAPSDFSISLFSKVKMNKRRNGNI